MGHYVEMLTFEEGVPKTKIVQYCEEWGKYNCDRQENPNGGLPRAIEFKNVIFNSRAEAEEYLSKLCGNYEQVAVRFKVRTRSEKQNATRKKMYDDLTLLNKQIREIEKSNYFEDRASKFIGCKHCGSKLNISYLKDVCPVCKKDLRSETFLTKLNKAKVNASNLEEKLYELKDDVITGQIDWLVKLEVHC